MPLGQNQSFTTTNLNYTIMKKSLNEGLLVIAELLSGYYGGEL